MGCSFLAPIQNIVGKVADVVAPIAAAIPGPWQVPAMVYLAVDTVGKGGDLIDVVKRVGTAYVAGQIGAGISSAVSGAAVDAGVSAANAATIGNIAGGVGKAVVTGGDPLQALISGGIGAGVGELTGQIPGFSEMPRAAQDAVRGVMASTLQGKDPTQALVGQALSAGVRMAGDYAKSGPAVYGTDAPMPSQSGYPVQDMGISPENLASYQDTLKDTVAAGGFSSQWVPNADGTYTMTNDDGSTVKADGTGTILESTNATDTKYTGATKTTPKAATPKAAPIAGASATPLYFGMLGEGYSVPDNRAKIPNKPYDVSGTSIFNPQDELVSSEQLAEYVRRNHEYI